MSNTIATAAIDIRNIFYNDYTTVRRLNSSPVLPQLAADTETDKTCLQVHREGDATE
jgi:hypothetical protein